MKSLRLAAFAALLLAGCTDQPTAIQPPESPRLSTITSVHLHCPSSIAVGGSGWCDVWAWDSNGNYSNYTNSATWGSTDYGVVNVGSFGYIYGASAGYASVYAIVGGVWAWASVQVYQPVTPVPTTITVTPSSATVAQGQSTWLTAKVYDQNGNQMSGQTVTWSSSNSSVAQVASTGYVTGNGTGSATITASSSNLSASASISVVAGFSVAISGEDTVKPNEDCSWFADVSGGTAPYSYSWYVPNASGSSVYEPSSWTGSSSASSFTINLTVTDATNVSVSASKTVTTSTSLPQHWMCML